MTSIIRNTGYGDTMFVSNPIKAAMAIITWAVADGHSLCALENLDHGCIRVTIPGLTHITLAPEEKKHELSSCNC
jgi:hypothetical protein